MREVRGRCLVSGRVSAASRRACTSTSLRRSSWASSAGSVGTREHTEAWDHRVPAASEGSRRWRRGACGVHCLCTPTHVVPSKLPGGDGAAVGGLDPRGVPGSGPCRSPTRPPGRSATASSASVICVDAPTIPYAETVFELAVTENKRGARGLIPPAASATGDPPENAPLPNAVAELRRLGISPREVALDGGLHPGPDGRDVRRAGARPRSLAAKTPPPSAPATGWRAIELAKKDGIRSPHRRARAGPHPPEGSDGQST